MAGKVVWLDAFTANVDRTWRNPNLLLWHGDLWVIDHGASLYFHHAWSGGVTDPARFAGQPWDAADHVLVGQAGDLAAVDAEVSGLPRRVGLRRDPRRGARRVAGAGARSRRTRPRCGRRTSRSWSRASAPGSGCPEVPA